MIMQSALKVGKWLEQLVTGEGSESYKQDQESISL